MEMTELFREILRELDRLFSMTDEELAEILDSHKNDGEDGEE